MSELAPPPPPGQEPPPERLVPIVLPTGAPTRSPVLLIAVAGAAVFGLLANIVGLVGFPYNAPIEQVYALGICVDLIAIAVVSGVAAVLSRRGYPLRDRTPITTIAIAFAAASVVVWILAGGLSSIVGLATGNGRYMYAVGGQFYGGALWVLAAIFASHGYRRGGRRDNNIVAIIALAIAGSLALYAIVSSVIYGIGLTA